MDYVTPTPDPDPVRIPDVRPVAGHAAPASYRAEWSRGGRSVRAARRHAAEVRHTHRLHRRPCRRTHRHHSRRRPAGCAAPTAGSPHVQRKPRRGQRTRPRIGRRRTVRRSASRPRGARRRRLGRRRGAATGGAAKASESAATATVRSAAGRPEAPARTRPDDAAAPRAIVESASTPNVTPAGLGRRTAGRPGARHRRRVEIPAGREPGPTATPAAPTRRG